ncbi:hypothetical protein [Amycolatopsis anabasis]|uniref:hypothetical protein n=1 Tax=Amycolatopsis anabasis TaxID=1840409 RepID=UPI00131BC1EE|nr:hypothetical protein [Amycolatopsis anabasis]
MKTSDSRVVRWVNKIAACGLLIGSVMAGGATAMASPGTVAQTPSEDVAVSAAQPAISAAYVDYFVRYNGVRVRAWNTTRSGVVAVVNKGQGFRAYCTHAGEGGYRWAYGVLWGGPPGWIRGDMVYGGGVGSGIPICRM